MKKYYEAYEERYKQAHKKGIKWENENHTPIVMEMIRKYKINKNSSILEIGCGEGRDSHFILENGFKLLATDISKEAIKYCKNNYSNYEACFEVLDCIGDDYNIKYDFIYSVAVIHMLVLDEDRNSFYSFYKNHLLPNGLGLICSMGDGVSEMKSDINQAFNLEEREHRTGKIYVASTTCRMVSFDSFLNEIIKNDLEIVEYGITSAMPSFNSLMYAVIKNKTN
ncbi:MAG: class I SAM-dependent methyltransferase [Anaeroplasma sp.]